MVWACPLNLSLEHVLGGGGLVWDSYHMFVLNLKHLWLSILNPHQPPVACSVTLSKPRENAWHVNVKRCARYCLAVVLTGGKLSRKNSSRCSRAFAARVSGKTANLNVK